MKKKIISIKLICFFGMFFYLENTYAQKEKDDVILQKLIEKLTEYTESEGTDLLDISDQIEFYFYHPLNINSATYQEMIQIPILDPEEVTAIIAHREKYGDFINIYELQVIDEILENKFTALSYFFKIKDVKNQKSWRQQLKESNHELIYLIQQKTPLSKGYENPKQFKGDAYRSLVRYRNAIGNNVSFGFTLEKDAGEKMNFDNAQIFDFQSFYLFIQKIGKFKNIQIGDFQSSFGQGLTLGTGLAFGKSAAVLNMRKNFNGFRKYRSANENEFFRGFAATYQLGKFDISGFYSKKKWDASLQQSQDTMNAEDQAFSALTLSGLHRTDKEIAKQNVIDRQSLGTHIGFQSKKIKLGFTALHENFSPAFQPNISLYNQFNFSGNQYSKIGLDYAFHIKNIAFFGEFSQAINAGNASIHGILWSLSSKVDLAIMYRNYQRDFNPLLSNAISESSNPQNEKGLYYGVILKPIKSISISAYADIFNHDWLRYRVDAPSVGNEILVDFNYTPKRNTTYYVRYKRSDKQYNISENTTITDQLGKEILENYRFHVDYKPSKYLDLSTRIETTNFYSSKPTAHGMLIFQDIGIVSKSRHRFKVSWRTSFYKIEDYRARIYAYEGEVLYAFSIHQFNYTGTRNYILLSFSPSRKLDFWFRIAVDKYDNPITTGSGLDKIESDQRMNIKMQMRIKF